jgi:RimJ/RimL family protein N-acetyltransferase
VDAALSDGTIRLEPLAEQHLAGLAALGHDIDVQRYTYVPSPWVEGFERTWLERYARGHLDGTRAGFAIVDEADGAFLGLSALVRIDREGREAEAGYIVAPQARGRGIAARALGLLTDWALGDLGLERVELRITTDNLASQRVADRCGYVREGVLRSVHFKQGLRSDLAVYSRLAGDSG